MATRVNWSELTKRAGELVLAEQNATYEFIRSKLGGIGMETVSKLLMRLQAKGLVRRGNKRMWVVLKNPDGSDKDPSTLPPPRRFRKKRRRGAPREKANGLHVPTPSVTKLVATPRTSSPAGRFSHQQKIEFLQHLAGLAEGSKKLLLQTVVRDMLRLEKDEKLLEALKD